MAVLTGTAGGCRPTFPQIYIDGEFFGGCDITVGTAPPQATLPLCWDCHSAAHGQIRPVLYSAARSCCINMRTAAGSAKKTGAAATCKHAWLAGPLRSGLPGRQPEGDAGARALQLSARNKAQRMNEEAPPSSPAPSLCSA